MFPMPPPLWACPYAPDLSDLDVVFMGRRLSRSNYASLVKLVGYWPSSSLHFPGQRQVKVNEKAEKE